VYGPNGFYRVLAGNVNDAPLEINCEYQLSGNVQLQVRNPDKKLSIKIVDNAYGAATITKTLDKAGQANIMLDLRKSHSWYDFTVRVEGNAVFERRYAGHVETGKESFSDPVIGQETSLPIGQHS
jgi:phospholipase C